MRVKFVAQEHNAVPLLGVEPKLLAEATKKFIIFRVDVALIELGSKVYMLHF